MANLTIKNLPERLHKSLKKAAQEQGRSLNSYIVQMLERDAEEYARRNRMREGWKEFLKFRSTLPRVSDTTELIREDRER